MNKISVILISKDEEKKIRAAIESISWADEIILVDSGSADNTVNIAKEFTDKIYIRKFDNFSAQKNFALSKCNYEWIFSIDCDEVVTPKLKGEIFKAINANHEYSAFKVKRVNNFFGKVLKHSAGNDFPVRLFKKNSAKFIQPIHEFLEIKGKVGVLTAELLHNTTPDLKTEFEKTELYTEFEVQWLKERNIRPSLFRLLFCPFFIFFDIYFWRKGILDGKPGFLYALVSARYAFIKYSKARKHYKVFLIDSKQ